MSKFVLPPFLLTSANVGGCRLPLSGRSQKLRGENKWANVKTRFYTVFRPNFKAGHRERK